MILTYIYTSVRLQYYCIIHVCASSCGKSFSLSVAHQRRSTYMRPTREGTTSTTVVTPPGLSPLPRRGDLGGDVVVEPGTIAAELCPGTATAIMIVACWWCCCTKSNKPSRRPSTTFLRAIQYYTDNQYGNTATLPQQQQCDFLPKEPDLLVLGRRAARVVLLKRTKGALEKSGGGAATRQTRQPLVVSCVQSFDDEAGRSLFSWYVWVEQGRFSKEGHSFGG